MKKALFAILLLIPVLAWPEKKNPADYTLAVHVESSRVDLVCNTACLYSQHLVALVDGKRYELLSAPTPTAYLLRLGDYRAKVAKDLSDQPYEYLRSYEFLFASGTTQTYTIIGEDEEQPAK